jgi:hypothetical protein
MCRSLSQLALSTLQDRSKHAFHEHGTSHVPGHKLERAELPIRSWFTLWGLERTGVVFDDQTLTPFEVLDKGGKKEKLTHPRRYWLSLLKWSQGSCMACSNR